MQGNTKPNTQNKELVRIRIIIHIILPACFYVHHIQKKSADCNMKNRQKCNSQHRVARVSLFLRRSLVT